MYLFNKFCDFWVYLYPKELPDDQPALHQSPINPKTLLIIRICSFLYLTGIYIWEIQMSQSALINIIYLTQWGYFFTWLYFLLVLQHYLLHHYQILGYSSANSKQRLKYYVELVYQFAFDSQLPITLVFWAILFRIVLQMEGVTAQIIALNANLHAGPLICLLIQFPFNSFKFHYRHFSVVMILGCIYLLINMLYSVLVSPVYRPIDWISIISYLLCIGAIALAYLMHLIGRQSYMRWKSQKLGDDSYLLMTQTKQIQFVSHKDHHSEPQIKSDAESNQD